jgi:hypothetical protein
MDKVSYVYANIQLMLKNPPENYWGLVHDNYSVCKNNPEPLSVLLCNLIKVTTDFYATTMRDMPTEEINRELLAVGRYIANLKVEEKVDQK